MKYYLILTNITFNEKIQHYVLQAHQLKLMTEQDVYIIANTTQQKLSITIAISVAKLWTWLNSIGSVFKEGLFFWSCCRPVVISGLQVKEWVRERKVSMSVFGNRVNASADVVVDVAAKCFNLNHLTRQTLQNY